MAITTQLNSNISVAYAPICGGTTAAGPVQSVASVGSSGQVLTSNGAGNLPTFQAAAAPTGTPILLKVPMTLAQFTGMKVTPFQIIPAQGANTVILVCNLLVKFSMSSVDFASGGTAGLQYGNTASYLGNKISDILTATEIAGITNNAITSFIIPVGLNSATTYPIWRFATAADINTGVFITNATNAFTGGTGATVDVNVVYTVVNTS